jgi:ubiquinone/menaquinone biosynthesis C-methylase UbiE
MEPRDFAEQPKGHATEEARIKVAYERRDRVVDRRRYSYFDPGNLFLAQERERLVLATLKQWGLEGWDGKKVLEVGCGAGGWLRQFIRWGAQPEGLVGIDLSAQRIAVAQHLLPSSVALYCESAAKLRFPDATFDLVLQATVFSSILEARLKQQIAREMVRVLKPMGLILWIDFFVDNPRNPDVKGVAKSEIRGLFPDYNISFRRVTPAPPLVRILAPRSWLLCSLLSAIRVLNTHYLVAISRKS